jgi:hypothetical protein
MSHAMLADHFARTGAVLPLDRDPGREQPGEVPETFPAGV